MARTYISQFMYKDQNFDVLYSASQISYVFEREGKRYGNAVKVEGKTIRDVMNASICLVVNLIETYDSLTTNTPTLPITTTNQPS